MNPKFGNQNPHHTHFYPFWIPTPHHSNHPQDTTIDIHLLNRPPPPKSNFTLNSVRYNNNQLIHANKTGTWHTKMQMEKDREYFFSEKKTNNFNLNLNFSLIARQINHSLVLFICFSFFLSLLLLKSMN